MAIQQSCSVLCFATSSRVRDMLHALWGCWGRARYEGKKSEVQRERLFAFLGECWCASSHSTLCMCLSLSLDFSRTSLPSMAKKNKGVKMTLAELAQKTGADSGPSGLPTAPRRFVSFAKSCFLLENASQLTNLAQLRRSRG